MSKNAKKSESLYNNFNSQHKTDNAIDPLTKKDNKTKIRSLLSNTKTNNIRPAISNVLNVNEKNK